ncbi:hypothetical protein ATANTOWER_008695 [Ataeniobius toweri]|uniref:Uncharacterized protein n=1 Tax=Ataeniobius toweri TaxID=208326 RepID=A0ABU7AN25_9TELE|nr:hypothetical protein [Ataeniobius toweri]
MHNKETLEVKRTAGLSCQKKTVTTRLQHSSLLTTGQTPQRQEWVASGILCSCANPEQKPKLVLVPLRLKGTTHVLECD